MIKPTVGRMVWYWHCLGDIYNDVATLGRQPMAAIICYVHDDRMVNLSVVDHDGQQFGATNVPLLQDDERPDKRGCAQWMPYQKGQAAKTEALEAKAAEAPVDALTTLLGSITQRQADPVPMGEAPRVTMEHIESLIESEHYFTAGAAVEYAGAPGLAISIPADTCYPNSPDALDLLTFCVLTLRNGFTITGQSIPQVGTEFDAERGRKQARENAISQIWPLELYLLKQRLYEQDQDAEQMLVAELDAGTAAAEALVDHLQAMGSPGRAAIPVKRGDSEYEVIVSRK